VRLGSSIQLPTGTTLPPSHLVIFKIYDPRYTNHRDVAETRPWSLEGERAAVENRQVAEDRYSDILRRGTPEESPGYEEWYYEYFSAAFKDELESYSRLRHLQGTGIPVYYGSATLPLTHRYVKPHAGILEYIPSSTVLKDLSPPTLFSPALARSVAGVIAQLGQRGVIHADVNPGNILLSPSDNPTRAVLIDFGAAIIRHDDTPDEIWDERVVMEDDIGGLKFSIKTTLKISYEQVKGTHPCKHTGMGQVDRSDPDILRG
jgi:serine/threonine protein kinase